MYNLMSNYVLYSGSLYGSFDLSFFITLLKAEAMNKEYFQSGLHYDRSWEYGYEICLATFYLQSTSRSVQWNNSWLVSI